MRRFIRWIRWTFRRPAHVLAFVLRQNGSRVELYAEFQGSFHLVGSVTGILYHPGPLVVSESEILASEIRDPFSIPK
jgi:hypothetical protein